MCGLVKGKIHSLSWLVLPLPHTGSGAVRTVKEPLRNPKRTQAQPSSASPDVCRAHPGSEGGDKRRTRHSDVDVILVLGPHRSSSSESIRTPAASHGLVIPASISPSAEVNHVPRRRAQVNPERSRVNGRIILSPQGGTGAV